MMNCATNNLGKFKRWQGCVCFLLFALLFTSACSEQENVRQKQRFTENWKFHLGDVDQGQQNNFDDSDWRALTLPHDWSIEGKFSEDNPGGTAEAALPTGIGWYRKTFEVPSSTQGKKVFIDFDGIYRDSKVWINGHLLGRRPNGYISFRYDLTPYLNYGEKPNVLAVRVNNSGQPNSRWYSGSGIYRNVWLVTTNKTHVRQWGTFIKTPKVTKNFADVKLQIKVQSKAKSDHKISIETSFFNEAGDEVASKATDEITPTDSLIEFSQNFTVDEPNLWSVDHPYMYRAVTKVYDNGELTDRYETPFGIRTFHFDAKKGFFLNGNPMKILGVCKHHDLGPLGAAVNKRAIERQLELFKNMGANAIRTAHNPPSPELLELADRMGFIVMDEAFDMWAKEKTDEDYHIYWDKWHTKDLQDQVKRDRNHPSIFIWSIGNEIREQFDSTGIGITRDLVKTIKDLDKTRPVTSALTENKPDKNFIYKSGALDLIGFNYKHEAYSKLDDWYLGEKLIATENMCAMATRGHYDMPSDSVRYWPQAYDKPLENPNPNYTVSAYDNVAAYWGSTHEATWKTVKKLDYMSGLFVWTGIDYLGEPTPYPWPARSSYFGIVDLAGFPKDSYYMYQSEWTDKTVLHLFPHWNWKPGKTLDVWAYFNHADEVELFLNEKSMGVRRKEGDDLHVMWRLKYKPGKLKAVSRKDGKKVATRTIQTAGKPAKIELHADRKNINANGRDLSFITVNVLDKNGNLVPHANNRVDFKLEGPAKIAGVGNGYQASLEPFKADHRKAFNGTCLAIIKSKKDGGRIRLKATAEGLETATITIKSD